MKIPIYGAYCGPEHGTVDSSKPPQPIDELDAACMRHDACYAADVYFSCACDTKLVTELKDVPRRGLSNRLARLSVHFYFTAVAPLYCKAKALNVQMKPTLDTDGQSTDSSTSDRADGITLMIEMAGMRRHAFSVEKAEIMSLFTSGGPPSSHGLEPGEHILRIRSSAQGELLGDLISPMLNVTPRRLKGVMSIMGYVVWVPADTHTA